MHRMLINTLPVKVTKKGELREMMGHQREAHSVHCNMAISAANSEGRRFLC